MYVHSHSHLHRNRPFLILFQVSDQDCILEVFDTRLKSGILSFYSNQKKQFAYFHESVSITLFLLIYLPKIDFLPTPTHDDHLFPLYFVPKKICTCFLKSQRSFHFFFLLFFKSDLMHIIFEKLLICKIH